MSINNEKPWRGSRQWIIRADDGPFQQQTTWCATWPPMRTWAARQLRVITHDCAAHVVTRKHVHLGLRHHQEDARGSVGAVESRLIGAGHDVGAEGMRRSLAARGKRSHRQRGWKFLHALSIGPGPVRDDERPQGDQMLPPSQRRRRVCAQGGIGQAKPNGGESVKGIDVTDSAGRQGRRLGCCCWLGDDDDARLTGAAGKKCLHPHAAPLKTAIG